MGNKTFVIQIEKRIIGLMMQVKNGKITITQSNLDNLVDSVKTHDEVLYEEFQQKLNKLRTALK